jgi:hypothetical protein
MTDLRQAAQQALKALEALGYPLAAIAALRDALAQVEQEQAPVAWRFRTAGIEHSAWRLTDDAGLVEQMRKLGHWDIRPLGELPTPAPAEGGA